jgi:hypothetical protein
LCLWAGSCAEESHVFHSPPIFNHAPTMSKLQYLLMLIITLATTETPFINILINGRFSSPKARQPPTSLWHRAGLSLLEKKSPLYTTVTDHHVQLNCSFVHVVSASPIPKRKKKESMWNWLTITSEGYRQGSGKTRSAFIHEFASITSIVLSRICHKHTGSTRDNSNVLSLTHSLRPCLVSKKFRISLLYHFCFYLINIIQS